MTAVMSARVHGSVIASTHGTYRRTQFLADFARHVPAEADPVGKARDCLVSVSPYCWRALIRQRLLQWRGFDPDRFEAAHVMLERDALRARGTSLAPSYALQYALVTNAEWITREFSVRVQTDTWTRTLVLRRAVDGEWSADRDGTAREHSKEPLPDLRDAVDCDLALCPLTNTMPILRHDIVGRSHRREPAEFDDVMAWVSVPDLAVQRSDQRYAVGDPVEAGTGALVHFATEGFRTTLEVDGDGLMVNYPGLARRIDDLTLNARAAGESPEGSLGTG
jgi:uncharacterized protein